METQTLVLPLRRMDVVQQCLVVLVPGEYQGLRFHALLPRFLVFHATAQDLKIRQKQEIFRAKPQRTQRFLEQTNCFSLRPLRLCARRLFLSFLTCAFILSRELGTSAYHSSFHLLPLDRRYLVVPALPLSASGPEEGEADRGLLRFRHGYVRELDAERRGCGPCVRCGLPLVPGPAQPEGGGRLHTERKAFHHRARLAVRLPDLEQLVPLLLVQVPLCHGRDPVEDRAVVDRAQQLEVFGMGPRQRHGGAR